MAVNVLTALTCAVSFLALAVPADAAETAEHVYAQGFEDSDPTVFWTGSGKRTVNFKGLTDSKAFEGSKSLKIDVSFAGRGFAYWSIPLNIPAEGELKLSARIYLGEETKRKTVHRGYKSARADVGVNFMFRPSELTGLPTFDQTFEAEGGQPLSQWIPIEGDLVSSARDTARIVPQHRWGATPENVSPYVDKLVLLISGREGDRVVVYVDDIKIQGKVPTEADYRRNVKRRWSPVKRQLDRKLSSWKMAVSRIENGLKSVADASAEVESLKKQLQAEAASASHMIKKVSREGFISHADYQKLQSSPTQYKDTLRYLRTLAGPRSTGEKMLVFVGRPISNVKVLPAEPFVPGRLADRMDVTACPGEYEPATFTVRALADIPALRARARDLVGDAGSIPSENIDIKVVKCWYQGGTAWHGIAPGLPNKILVPELLLNDASLVKVDHKAKRNHLKLARPGGDEYVCISDSQQAKASEKGVLSVEDYPIKDAAAFAPLDMAAKTNQQFWLTVKVPPAAAAGQYRGNVVLSSAGKELRSLSLNVRVLPFQLAPPKRYDLGGDFTSSVYYRGKLSPDCPHGTISSECKSPEQLEAELRDMFTHGIASPIIGQGKGASFDRKLLGQYLAIRKKAGMTDRGLYMMMVWAMSAPPATIADLLRFVRPYGIDQAYFYGRDEARGHRLTSQRATWEATRAAGGKVIAAGKLRGRNFELMGDITDVFILLGHPSRNQAERWHSLGHKLWCYANPQAGVEDPEVYRRNFGLVLWKANYDGAATYAYQHGFGTVWNDFDSTVLRDLVFTYPTVDGVIDTIAWEGYREAIDDIRYATTLKLEIAKAGRSADSQTRAKALAAERWLAGLAAECEDLDATRARIISRILDLR